MQVASAAAIAPDAAVAHGLTVETITDERVFRGLQAEWDDVVDRAQIGHPFLCHDWLRTWWECFGADAQLHLIVVRAGGTRLKYWAYTSSNAGASDRSSR